MLKTLLYLCCAVCLSSCKGNTALSALNTLTPNQGYSLVSGLSFGAQPRQTMDVYTPDKATDQSRVVVFVYGGAWRKGIKEDYAFVAHALAREGHWLIVPDYQLYPSVTFPTFVEDVAEAIKAIPNALGDSKPSPNQPLQITLMGHSSGAHTASLIAADRSWLGDAPVIISQLVAMSGPYDLPLDNPEVSNVFASALDSTAALPIEKITVEHPPTLLIHGEDDTRVLPKHSKRYSEALRENNIEVDMLMLEGAGHAAPLTGLSRLLPDNGTREAVLDFLDKSRPL